MSGYLSGLAGLISDEGSGLTEGFVPGRTGVRYESAVPEPDSSAFDGIMELPTWSGPTDVMLQALVFVQRDLDTAGLTQYVMGYAVAGGSAEHPTVNVQWRGTWTNDGIDLHEDDLARVTVDVAAQAAQGLLEIEGVYWPACPAHGVRARATVDHGGRAVWACNRRGVSPHVVSPIGDLSHLTGRGASNKPLWRTLKELAGP